MKVTIIVHNKAGHVLGQAVTSKERIIIGRDAACTISLSDDKVASIENEIYLMNDECWLQVSKEGAPVTLKGKQYRTIKIEDSSTLFFRQYSLKIILEKSADAGIEATRVVDSADLKTRVVSNLNEEKTRFVQENESTRILEKTAEFVGLPEELNEPTRVLETVDEKTRVVEDHDFQPKIAPRALRKAVVEVNNEDTMSFGFEKESELSGFRKNIQFNRLSQRLSQLSVQELGFIAITTIVSIFVIKFMFFNGKNQDLSLEKVVSEQELKLQKMQTSSAQALSGAPLSPTDQTIQSVTREEYLRSLSSFFDKH